MKFPRQLGAFYSNFGSHGQTVIPGAGKGFVFNPDESPSSRVILPRAESMAASTMILKQASKDDALTAY